MALVPPELVRSKLIDEAIRFTVEASRLPGITRIALIGSLTTPKRDPKDADLLVTVEDDMDLEHLATLTRKFKGHTVSFGYGGEVFVADTRGTYLGRICSWKRCHPGVRMSCYAINCGRRHYLYDDLQIIKLPESLVASPPIELWPQVVTRVPVPRDVERALERLKPSEGKEIPVS